MLLPSVYRGANAIFGKIGRTTSEVVIIELIKSKCIPVLLYGLEACHLIKAQMRSIDCCKPSGYEVIQNEQYRNREISGS